MPPRAQKNQRQILEYPLPIAAHGFRLGPEDGTMERQRCGCRYCLHRIGT
jgi:hypothetical protein